MNYDFIRQSDPDIYYVMENELERQRDHIELIASENFTSEAVMEAMGSHLTNKYAEGYPAARFYGGCENVDHIEKIAIRRAKSLYKAEYANVQPHAGSQANVAVYTATFACEPACGCTLAYSALYSDFARLMAIFSIWSTFSHPP